MREKNCGSTNQLDIIRLEHGVDGLKDFFCRFAVTNPDRAINLINRNDLSYTSLFILRNDISSLDLYKQISPERRRVLDITNAILSKNSLNTKRLLCCNRRITSDILQWILGTGFYDDGLDNQYEELMDITSILLLKNYRVKTVFLIITSLIFNRNKKGLFIHDLVWAFFECCDPYSLLLIADHFNSNEYKDVELACKLLNFIPGIRPENSFNYSIFLNWFRENSLFIYYTGESFQQKPNPKTYALSLEAKYLCKAVCPNTGITIIPLTKTEAELLKNFIQLNYVTKLLLSSYSFSLHCRNLHQWNEWLTQPLSIQLNTAKTKTGGIP